MSEKKMKVNECISLVIKTFAKTHKPANRLANYSGKYKKDATKAMELFGNFEAQADAITMRITEKQPDIYHALGETVMEKSLLKSLEKEGALPTSVDLMYEGDAEMEVRGIGCTFMATLPVLEEAKKKGLNFIITHEPTYYNGIDDVSWLQNDAVWQYKHNWIKENGITIWRMHDIIHLFQPDMIVHGVLDKLGLYEKASYTGVGNVMIDCDMSKKEFYDLMCKNLNCKSIRKVGKMSGKANKIGFFVGSIGGRPQISLASSYDLDVIVCGEINEWETCAYIRDANAMGREITLFVIGHQESETAGMEFFAEWIKKEMGEIPVEYLESGPMLDAVE